jgi:iron complex outermembrane receptor protein
MMPMRFSSVFVLVLVLAAALPAGAQTPAPQAPATPQVTLPTVIVTAQKDPADAQSLPVSLTAVPVDPLWNGGSESFSDLSIYAPNAYFVDFSARKLSNARFRGIGASPANPAVTTYIDGVPQLNSNSSNIELLDVSQVEFVRGPQSSLFGRNTLGGVVNVASTRPSTSQWKGNAAVPFGNYNAFDVSADASGPLGAKAAAGVAIGHSQRDGFSTNTVTGHDVDARDATFGKAQLLFTPGQDWEARFIYTGEHARDGDYALNDLAAVRANPFQVARDYEGHTDRDINAETFLLRHAGKGLTFSSTTGFVHWKTEDATDLDYSPYPLITRDNNEKDLQFTEEVHLASGPEGAVTLGSSATLKWQGGLFLFTQNYDQDAVNTYNAGVLSPFIPIATHQHNPQASLDDTGVGLYGSGTISVQHVDFTAGARFDHENKKADLSTFFDESFLQIPAQVVKAEKGFSNVSPQFSVGYHASKDALAYFSVTNGYKAGGFNPASPPGSEAYGEEHTWNYEGGVKSEFAGHRVLANLAVFTIDWQDLQLNVPNPSVPGQYYISNVGSARSSGFEAELTARPSADVNVYAAYGLTHARFGSGTTSGGVAVGGNEIPNAPSYTATIGTELSHPLGGRGVRLYGRAEGVFYGAFKYDEANTEGQDAYGLANFRAGARARRVFAEFWIRNAFDTKYVPVAFAYPGIAPSGFVGEPGKPRTFGATAGVSF